MLPQYVASISSYFIYGFILGAAVCYICIYKFISPSVQIHYQSDDC